MLQREGKLIISRLTIISCTPYLRWCVDCWEQSLWESCDENSAPCLSLSDEQEALVVPLLNEACPALDVLEKHGSYNLDNQSISYSEELQQMLKWQRLEELQAEKAKVNIDLTAVPASSMNCERLFSAANFILSDTRNRTSPKLFGGPLLLLKVNSNKWNSVAAGKADRQRQRWFWGGQAWYAMWLSLV